MKQPNVKQCLLNKRGEHFGVKPLWFKNPGVPMKKKDSFPFVVGILLLRAILKDIPKKHRIKCRTSKMDSFKVVGNLENTKNKMSHSINLIMKHL